MQAGCPHTCAHKTLEAQDGARAGKRKGEVLDGSGLPTPPYSGADVQEFKSHHLNLVFKSLRKYFCQGNQVELWFFLAVYLYDLGMFRQRCVEGICTLVLASQISQVGLGAAAGPKGSCRPWLWSWNWILLLPCGAGPHEPLCRNFG